MIEFHWLKVKHRILYKQLVIVHNCLHLKAPEEIMCMFRYAESIRTMKLQEKRCFNKYGERAFSHSGPKLWNLLPLNIREEHETEEFKKSLKSFLMMRGDEYCSWIKMRWLLLFIFNVNATCAYRMIKHDFSFFAACILFSIFNIIHWECMAGHLVLILLHDWAVSCDTLRSQM